MDDEADTYKLWRVRKTIMQVRISLLLNDSLLNKFASSSYVMTEAILLLKMNWISHWTNLKRNLVTSRGKFGILNVNQNSYCFHFSVTESPFAVI